MMRASSILALLVALSIPLPAGAQTAPEVKGIEIRNQGPGRIDESFVFSHIAVKAGGRLDRAEVAKSVRDLLATGRIADISVEVEPAGDGVKLIYALKGRYRLTEAVALQGVTHFRESTVREYLGVYPGDYIDDQSLGKGAKRVADEYRKARFPDVKITWRLEETEAAQGLCRLTLTVAEGQRARIREVKFEGNQAVEAGPLRQAMKERSGWNPVRWFTSRRYDPDELDAGRLSVHDLYQDRGYLDVDVGEPKVTADEKGNLTVSVPVREGKAYRIGKVSLEGVALFPEPVLMRLITLKPGDPASMSQVSRAAQALRDYYGSRGYILTEVKPVLDTNAAAGTVSVVFSVVEGQLTRIGNIQIRGNSRTKDKVIRRELLVSPGDVFDEVRVRKSESRVANLGFFEQVRAYPGAGRNPEERDLLVDVEEKRTGQFMVGAGFSSVDNLVGFMEISQGNFDLKGWPYFTGGGQKLKLRTEVGSKRKDYEISFVEPWFLDRKLSLGVDLYRSDVSYDDYDVERTGAAISLGRSLSGPNRIDFKYRIEKVLLEDVADTNRYVYADAPNEEFFFPAREDRIESTLSVSVTHDTRDNPFLPSRGNRSTLSASLSGGPLGFDTDMYDLGLRAAQYFPLWFGHILSLKTRWEVIDEYGDTEDIPLSDRLFAGGGRTLRGFDYRDVGPKVVRQYTTSTGQTATTHRPVGGKSLALASAEYTIPIVSKVRLAAFYDIGNVWRDSYEFSLENLASSTGLGIRFDVPGFPMRIDYGWPIRKDSDLTKSDAWTIWIGYDY